MAKAPKTSRRNKRFTESEFETVRKLADAGLTQKQVSDILGGRRNPINLIMAHDLKTWSEYVAKRKEESESRRADQKPPVIVKGELPEEPTPVEQVNVDEVQEMLAMALQYKPAKQGEVTLADINSTLVAINTSLEALVEAWQNEPKKRKLF